MPAPNAASDHSVCLSPKPSQPLPLRWGICETHQCVFITGWTPTKAARRHGHPSGIGAVPSPQAGQPWQRPAGGPAWPSGTSQQLTGQQGARAGPARPHSPLRGGRHAAPGDGPAPGKAVPAPRPGGVPRGRREAPKQPSGPGRAARPLPRNPEPTGAKVGQVHGPAAGSAGRTAARRGTGEAPGPVRPPLAG